jgi:hypothetical protein
MKPILRFSSITLRHKYFSKALVFLLLLMFNFRVLSTAQCIAGYTSATLDWDNMDYFHRNGGVYGGNNPVTGLNFVTPTMAQIQYFALGTNKLTINTTIPVGTFSSVYGDVTEHTGETGAYGTGADIKYVKGGTGAVTITMTFASEVRNLKFSVFDIDQEITFAPTATNAASVAQSITLTKPAGAASAIPLNGNAALTTVNGTAPLANWVTGGGSGTAYAVNSNLGTVNVDIAGPVKTVVLSFSNDGNTNDFWLSDITACTPDPGFPSSYYSPYTIPYTNQPAYFLANPQNLHMYMVNASNGSADYIFSDPGNGGQGSPLGTNKMNSIAYDPVNHWIYYTMDNATQYPGNLVLKKYDVTTGTISTVISNINTFGLPSFIQGIEYAGAAFYNGSLYLGIEGSDGTSYGTYGESVVWRIDFDGSGNTTGSFCQAFGTPGDIGSGAPTHDWGDFIVKDGGIITHATGPTTTSNHYIHYNLQTGASTSYAGGAGVAGQLGQIHNGNVYKIDSTLSLYNNNGTVSLVGPITVTSCSPAWYKANAKNSAGDASDPFRPMQDFGDAPATYDPVALTIAANQKACNNSTLRIGSAWGDEWSKYTTADASGDDEEDGVTTVTVMVSDGIPYNHVQDVVVLNNTGANAYLAGWLDYDADGLFEAGEGVVVTVPSSASPQTISLGWTGITVAIGTPNSFLRVRLSSSALTTSNATGWFSDGETEDYPVISQSLPLAVQLLDFNATLTRDKDVSLNWKASADQDASGFEIERSKDQNTWENIGSINVNSASLTSDYSLLDQQPLQGKSYYRLKLVERSGSSRYSNTRLIQIDQLITKLRLYPNPVKKDVAVSFNSTVDQSATLTIRSLSGVVMIKRPVSLNQGDNRMQLSTDRLSNGMYLVELITPEKTFINRLTVAH